QAPLWGLGRTIALEHTSLWGGLIDLSSADRASAREDAEALYAELQQPGRETEVAVRRGKRFVARLARRPRDTATARSRAFRSDATYLITGGLGMLGLAIARWMVERHGVRSLVLASRRAPEGKIDGALEGLRARGAVVDVVSADVGVEVDVRRLVEA